MTESNKKIVVIGGSYAGRLVVEFFTKHASQFEVVWISASSHIYWNVAGPRLLVEPHQMSKAAVALADEANKHENVEFINAIVTSVDFDNKTVSLESHDDVISYDAIVIASGARAHHPAFKLGNQPFEITEQEIKQLSEQIKAASSVAIIGGGPTGVETAAEIAHTYKDTTVTLYTGASGPLADYGSHKTTSGATRKLEALNVKIVNDVLISDVADTADGKKLLTLPDGSTNTVDVCIFATGLIPNTEFIDQSLLTNGFVNCDLHFRITGKDHAYVLGDVASVVKTKTFANIKMQQAKVIFSTLSHDLVSPSTREVQYNPDTSTVALVPVSRGGGVGLLFGWIVPSLLVRALKSKDFMLGKAISEMSI